MTSARARVEFGLEATENYMEEKVYDFLIDYPFETKNPDEKKYIAKIRDGIKADTFLLGIDYTDIYAFWQTLDPKDQENEEYYQVFEKLIKSMEKSPTYVTKVFKDAVFLVIKNKFKLPTFGELTFRPSNFDVYIYGYGRDVALSAIDSTFISRLIRTRGMVFGYEDDILIKVISSVFVCTNCEAEIKMQGSNQPKECLKCGENNFQEDMDKQERVDCLNIILQEPFESRSINNFTSMVRKVIKIEGKALVNHFKATIPPGSTIEVIGIVTMSPKRPPAGTDPKKYSMMRTEIFAMYMESKINDAYEFNPELQQIITTVKPDYIVKHVKKLLASIAPHIFGHTIIKLAMLLQIVGAPPIMVGTSRLRGDIHILLVGDPGEAKSEFGKTFNKLVIKSVYVQADNVTGVGLTSAVMPPDDMGSRRIELGAMPLANGSGVFIEEADKVRNPDDLNNLSSALDDIQTIVPRKGGFMYEIPTRCCCIFAANPKKGVNWDSSKSIYEQTKFPTWFLSRMDLVFINKKSQDKKLQEKILQHRTSYIINAEHEDEYNRNRKLSDSFSKAKLNEIRRNIENNNYEGTYNYDYIINELHYLKTHYNPSLPQESDAYKEMNQFIVNAPPIIVQNKDGTVDSFSLVDNRTLNTLIRLALASARLHRRNMVTKEDAKIAIHLLQESINSRNIESPSLTESGEDQMGAGAFMNPKVTNSLLRLCDNAIKSENDRFKIIMKSLSIRAKYFNAALMRYGVLRCGKCKGQGFFVDINSRERYACEICEGNGKMAQPFDIHIVEDNLLGSERTPFTKSDELKLFVEQYVKLGYLTQESTFMYVLKADIMDSKVITRRIDEFIRTFTAFLYEKEIAKFDETMKNKIGFSSVNLSDIGKP